MTEAQYLVLAVIGLGYAISFVVCFVVIVDVMIHLLGIMRFRELFVFFNECERCGKQFEHPVYSLVVWKRLTHRCDDNLI